jgi:nucleoid-associated protein YgaU
VTSTDTRFISRRRAGLRAAVVIAVVASLLAIPIGNVANAQTPEYMLSATCCAGLATQVGTVFSEQPSAKVVDPSNAFAGVGGIQVTFTVPATGASGTFSNGTNTITVTSKSSGVDIGFAYAGPFTANNIAGTYTMSVTATNSTPTAYSFTNTENSANLAATISTGDGSNQATLINTAFAQPLSAIVFNGSGLMSGASVTFTAPASGASGTFAATGTNTTTVVTGATGVATTSTFTANGTAGGPYIVTATVDGSQTVTGEDISTTFALRNTLTNVNGVPDVVSAAAGNGQNSPVLTTYNTNLQVVVLDGSLQYVEGATVTFTTPLSGPSGTFSNGSNEYTTTTGPTGLATALPLTANATIGAFGVTVTATKSGVTATGGFALSVGKVHTTTTVTIDPPGTSVYGQEIAIDATVAAVEGPLVPAGPVNFYSSGAAIGSCSSVSPSGGVATCLLNFLAPGNYSYSADYLGDDVTFPSSSTAVAHTVVKADTAIDLVTSAPTFALGGDTVTFTATLSVVAPGSGTPTGGIVFTSSDGTPLNGGNPVALVNGVAQVSTNALLLGSHTITATYAGDTNFNGSNDTLIQHIYSIPEVTDDPDDLLVLVGDTATFTAAATGVPVPTVQWQVSTDGGATFNDIPGATSGTLSFTASGSDDQNQYQAVFTNAAGTDTSAAATLTVRQPPAITSADATTFTVGVEGAFTVTATGILTPTLSMTGALPGGVAFDTASGLLSGTPADGTGGVYPLVFTATNGVAPDAVQNFTLTVNESPEFTSADTTTFIAGSPHSFSVTASGYPAPALSQTGTLPLGVTFASDGTLSGTPLESGVFPLTITASNGVAPDAVQSFTLTVEKADQAPLFVTVVPSTGMTGDKLSLGTTGGSGTGAVTFSVGSSDACVLGTGADAGLLIITKGIGSCVVSATKAGDAIYNEITSPPFTVDVFRAPSALVVDDAAGVVAGTVTLTATLTTGGAPIAGRQIGFSLNGARVGFAITDASGVATLSNVSLSGIAQGVYADVIAGSFTGDDQYLPSDDAATLTVNVATSTVVTSSESRSPAGQAVTFTAAVTPSTATGTVTFMDGATTLGAVALVGGQATFTTSSLGVGQHTIKAVYSGDNIHAPSMSPALTQHVMTVTTLALTSSANPSVFGQQVTFTATVSSPNATGVVVFRRNGAIIGSGTIVNGVATFTTAAISVGAHNITATYSGDAAHFSSVASLTQTVTSQPRT